MNSDQAIEAAQQAGVDPGECLFIEAEADMANPTDNAVDGWLVTHNHDGTWGVEAQYTDGPIMTSGESQPLPSGGVTEDSRYNDEAVYLNGLLESRPDVLNSFSPEEQAMLRMYYALQHNPPDIFVYRREVMQQKPGLAQQAEALFRKLILSRGLQDFTYTSYQRLKPGESGH